MFIKYLEKTLNDVKRHPSSGFKPLDGFTARDKSLDGFISFPVAFSKSFRS